MLHVITFGLCRLGCIGTYHFYISWVASVYCEMGFGDFRQACLAELQMFLIFVFNYLLLLMAECLATWQVQFANRVGRLSLIVLCDSFSFVVLLVVC